MSIISYDRIDEAQWSSLTAETPYASPFHEYEWGAMMADQLGADFLPLLASEGDRQWLLPVYRDLPWLADDEVRLSSVGYGGPLPTAEVIDGDVELAKDKLLLSALRPVVGSSALRTTLYPATFWPEEPIDSSVAYGSTCKVTVEGDADLVFENTISGNARTAVRKSIKSGVTVRELRSDDEDDVSEALDLLRTTQRDVGSSYETNPSLFRAISSLQGPELNSKTFVAEVDTAMVGMALCVYNRRELFHLFHGWDRAYAKTSANQALLWRMLSLAADLQIPSFNMGESHTPGLKQAKLRWGGHIESVPNISLKA